MVASWDAVVMEMCAFPSSSLGHVFLHLEMCGVLGVRRQEISTMACSVKS